MADAKFRARGSNLQSCDHDNNGRLHKFFQRGAKTTTRTKKVDNFSARQGQNRLFFSALKAQTENVAFFAMFQTKFKDVKCERRRRGRNFLGILEESTI